VQFAAIDGQQVFALLDVDAGQGERRGQAGGPVLPAEDFGDAVAAVFDLVVGAQQAGLGAVVGLVRPVDEHVADGDFAQHLGGEIGELGARGEAVEIRLVFGLDLGNAEAVGVGIVEEVALDAPGFVVDLPPLGAGIDDGFQIAQVQGLPGSVVAGLQIVGRGDGPAALARVEHLGAVAETVKASTFAEHDSGWRFSRVKRQMARMPGPPPSLLERPKGEVSQPDRGRRFCPRRCRRSCAPEWAGRGCGRRSFRGRP
jgi:hypothetical protein